MIKFINHLNFSFSSKGQHTVCIVAGGPHMDLLGSKLINTIKKHDKNYNFMGVGGKLMETAGLDKQYGDINKFCHKPLHPYKNFLDVHIERPYHPIYAWVHYKNYLFKKDLKKSHFFQDILDIQPQSVIQLSNDFFMSQFFFHLNSLYDQKDLVKPPCFFFDRTHINQRHEYLEFLDYCFSVVPLKPVNYQYFNFPHTIVGHEGIGRAWQYLYSKSDKFKQLQSDDYIYLSPEYQKQIIEKLVLEERHRFRSSHQLTEQQTVFFFAPGNIKSEIEFSIPKFQKGIKEFFSRELVKNINRDHFAVVVSVPDDSSASLITDKELATLFGCKTIVVKEKYSAMAGCDGGIVHNGEIASECSAMQLPIGIIDSIPFLQAYHTQLYNDWNNDLNIATKGETQQEMLSNSCTPWRIAEELLKFHSDPQLKYYLIDRFEKILYQMVPLANDYKGNELTQGDQTFVKHTYTLEAIAQKIIKASQKYEKTDKHIKSYQIKEFRESWIKQVQTA